MRTLSLVFFFIIYACAALCAETFFKGNFTFVTQGTYTKNITGAGYFDVGVGNKFNDFSTVFVAVNGISGEGIKNYTQTYSSLNHNSDWQWPAVHLSQAWYSYSVPSKKVVLSAGVLDPSQSIDTNRFANDETKAFLGALFAFSPTVATPRQHPVGIKAEMFFNSKLDLAIFASDAEGVFDTALNSFFTSAQLNFKAVPDGNYRVFGWFNGLEHISWSNPSETGKNNYGFGISIDQNLSKTVGMFARYSWQNPNVHLSDVDYSLNHAWSAGLSIIPINWGRLKDTIGLALGQILPSVEYKNACDMKARIETHYEVYYKVSITDNFSITPDIQLVTNPFGTDADGGYKNIFAFALRANLFFD
jgi:hypothetical protein